MKGYCLKTNKQGLTSVLFVLTYEHNENNKPLTTEGKNHCAGAFSFWFLSKPFFTNVMMTQRAACPQHWLWGSLTMFYYLNTSFYLTSHTSSSYSLQSQHLQFFFLFPVSITHLRVLLSLSKPFFHRNWLPDLCGAYHVSLPSLLLHHFHNHFLTHSFSSLRVCDMPWIKIIKCIICQGQVRLGVPNLSITKQRAKVRHWEREWNTRRTWKEGGNV